VVRNPSAVQLRVFMTEAQGCRQNPWYGEQAPYMASLFNGAVTMASMSSAHASRTASITHWAAHRPPSAPTTPIFTASYLYVEEISGWG
jgi:hypothetical protein